MLEGMSDSGLRPKLRRVFFSGGDRFGALGNWIGTPGNPKLLFGCYLLNFWEVCGFPTAKKASQAFCIGVDSRNDWCNSPQSTKPSPFSRSDGVQLEGKGL